MGRAFNSTCRTDYAARRRRARNAIAPRPSTTPAAPSGFDEGAPVEQAPTLIWPSASHWPFAQLALPLASTRSFKTAFSALMQLARFPPVST